MNGFIVGGGGGGGRRNSNEDLDDRFELMAQQISDLRAENTRLGADLRNLTILLTNKSEDGFSHSDSFEKAFTKSSRSLEINNDGIPSRHQHQQQHQHHNQHHNQHLSEIILGENGSPYKNENNVDKGLSVGWADRDRRSRRGSADSYDFEMTEANGGGLGGGLGGQNTGTGTGTGTGLGTGTGTGKISQALLLQQLENIQSQLDATKKELLGSVRKSSFSKPNPFFADNGRIYNSTQLSVTTGRQRSLSNHASPVSARDPNYPTSPSANQNYYTSSSSDTSIKRTVSGSGLISGSGKWAHEMKVPDDTEITNAANYEKLKDLTDNHFNNCGRLGSDVLERKKKLSPHRNNDDESQNNMISAANRCRDMANRNPVNTDLSSALDKYLNVVRKLSATTSTVRIDTHNGERAQEGRVSNGHSNYNSNGNSPISKGTNPVNKDIASPACKNNNLASMLHEFNRSPKPKDQDKQRDLTWRPSQGEKCSPDARYYLNSDEDPPSRSWITE